MFENIFEGLGESRKFANCTHSRKLTVSIIPRWDFVFNMTSTLPDMGESNRIDKTLSTVCLQGCLIYLTSDVLGGGGVIYL